MTSNVSEEMIEISVAQDGYVIHTQFTAYKKETKKIFSKLMKFSLGRSVSFIFQFFRSSFMNLDNHLLQLDIGFLIPAGTVRAPRHPGKNLWRLTTFVISLILCPFVSGSFRTTTSVQCLFTHPEDRQPLISSSLKKKKKKKSNQINYFIVKLHFSLKKKALILLSGFLPPYIEKLTKIICSPVNLPRHRRDALSGLNFPRLKSPPKV